MDRLPPPAVNAADLLIDAVAARPGTAAGDIAVHWVDRDRAYIYRSRRRHGTGRGGAGRFRRAPRRPGRPVRPSGARLCGGPAGRLAAGGDRRAGGPGRQGRLPRTDDRGRPPRRGLHQRPLRLCPATLAALGGGDSPTVFAGMDGPQPGTVGWLDALAEASPMAESPPPATTAAAGAMATTAPASATTRTHAELIEAATAVAARLDLTPSDATLCPTPLAQPFHLEASILPALLRGATAGCSSPGSPTTPGRPWTASAPPCCAAPPPTPPTWPGCPPPGAATHLPFARSS